MNSALRVSSVAVGLALALAVALALAACGGGPARALAPTTAARTSAPDAPPGPSASPLPAVSAPDIAVSVRNAAEVHGQRVAFDGTGVGLAWPSLERALGPRIGRVVTLEAARDVRVLDVLRAAWAVRTSDVRLQTKDATGAIHVAELGAKRARTSDSAPSSAGCHLAVFLRQDGSLRVAAPGGPRDLSGDRVAQSFARSLEEVRAECPIKYVGFGADSDEAPWGPVFDVLLAVDTAKAAGSARYVLAQFVSR